VWDEFGMSTFREYHELYNKTDVLLLADVFENFRDVCLKNYGLYLTKTELELLSDHDILLLIKKGIRGGISMVSKRYAKANNRHMGKTFDKIHSYIMYFDANNLYGWAISQKLPIHGFKWQGNVTKITITRI